MNNTLIPIGWAKCFLGDVLVVKNGYAFKSTDYSSEGIPLIRISDIQNGKVSTLNSALIPQNKAKFDFLIETGDLLIAMSGATTGKIGVYEGLHPCLQNQRVGNFKIYSKDLLDKNFRNFYVDSLRKQIEITAYGGAQPNISSSLLEGFEILLPPLNEQRRIVAKLEKLLAKVDTCKERLDKIPAILKRFRQSVLSAACSGRLTADWRENNPDVESAEELLKRIQIEKEKHYNEEHEKSQLTGKRKPKQSPKNELTPLTNRAYDGLPFNWCFTRIRDVSQCLDSQRIPVSKDERAKRIGNIPYYGANGQVGWIDDYIFDADLVLIVEDETFLGRQIPFSYIIRGKSWVNNHAHVIKPLGGISVDYLNICFSFYDFVPLTSGTTGRRKLTQAALMGAEFLIAPLQEQQEIVRRVQTLFKTADKIEQRYQKAKSYIDQLTQSILAKAFRGELVPQDPNDEPASVLLERCQNC
jgi:type I restriction enzyme S subunit